MNCINCDKSPIWIFTNKTKLCKNCFVKYFEKKILKNIRNQGGLSKDCVVKKGDVRNNIISSLIKNIIVNKDKKQIISLNNLNDISTKIIFNLLRKNKVIKKRNNLIYPFIDISDKEMNIYCQIKKINFNIKRKMKKDENSINNLIDIFEKTNPDVRHSIVNPSISF